MVTSELVSVSLNAICTSSWFRIAKTQLSTSSDAVSGTCAFGMPSAVACLALSQLLQ